MLSTKLICYPIYYITSQFDNIQLAKLQSYQIFKIKLSSIILMIKITCLDSIYSEQTKVFAHHKTHVY